jgi:hypothetical protein
MVVFESACERVGLDPAEVLRIARGLERFALQAQALGLQVFAGGSGSLRFHDNRDLPPLILVTSLRGNWDGGDGGCMTDDEGFLRGE